MKKNKGGRPRKFKDDEVEKMQKMIDEYFEFCDNRMKTVFHEKLGEIAVSNPAPYTMSGLANKLGMDRDTLINYSKKNKFFGTIKKARNRVQEDVENRLMETHNQSGAIFNLKNNFGWKDKTEQEHSGQQKIIVVTRVNGKENN